jgi:GDSL-like Lipase/Acylhydrolase family
LLRSSAERMHVVHIALLGDSIFDNSSYTRGEPDVVTHLRALLPTGARATLLAVDGAITQSISEQVRRIPADATHLVVSIGGNDALGYSDLLDARATSTADALRLFGQAVDRFETDYRSAMQPVIDRGLPVTICTIYNGALEDPDHAARARVALMLFNDVILRVAFEHHASVIDLRLVCSERADYANPIEPSGVGGMKIAQAIARATGAAPAGGHSACSW